MSNNLKINAQEQFNQLAESIFNDKKQDEFITISFGGERSHFLRFSQSKIQRHTIRKVNFLKLLPNGGIFFSYI